MKTLKKISAAVVAAATMACVAVTASAEDRPHITTANYDNGNHCIQIWGFPNEMNDFDTVLAIISFGEERIYDKELRVYIFKNDNRAECDYHSREANKYYNTFDCYVGSIDSGIIVDIEFPKDSEEYAEFAQFDSIGIAFVGITTDENGKTTTHYYSYEKGGMDDDNKVDAADYAWFSGWKDKASALLSDTTSSEPTSSTPAIDVSKPASSAPAASEPTTSAPAAKPTPDTGVGFSFALTAAAIAAGAVIVARKRK